MIEQIKQLLKEKEYVVIAIDGCAASGKTTLAKKLSNMFNASVIHMDDFFLPLEKRTEERLNTPGGNIDYERFKEEVVNNLDNDFTYNAFNCSIMKVDKEVFVKKTNLLIIEGSYSLHPYFGKYYDLSIFLDIDKDEQIDRIRNRDGEKLLKMFIEKWIKYETNYHDYYNIKTTADIYVK
ncbi:MAG: AAA family ATPase [Bacilli bacterium]|nr:AAA family ATPase [Bacilli bacterium]